MSQCVILVGGLGRRLDHLVRDVPKPMLEVGGRPFVVHVIRQAASFGFARFLLLAGYKAHCVEEYFGTAGVDGLQVEVLTETEPLGTAGALRAAKEHLEDRFLLTNGDSICRFQLPGLCAPFKSASTLGRMALRPIENNDRYGEVLVEGSLIRGFRERASGGGPSLMNAGLYWLRREFLEYLPAGPASLEKDVFPALAGRGLLEYGLCPDSYFVDIGLPEDLARARADFHHM